MERRGSSSSSFGFAALARAKATAALERKSPGGSAKKRPEGKAAAEAGEGSSESEVLTVQDAPQRKASKLEAGSPVPEAKSKSKTKKEHKQEEEEEEEEEEVQDVEKKKKKKKISAEEKRGDEGKDKAKKSQTTTPATTPPSKAKPASTTASSLSTSATPSRAAHAAPSQAATASPAPAPAPTPTASTTSTPKTQPQQSQSQSQSQPRSAFHVRRESDEISGRRRFVPQGKGKEDVLVLGLVGETFHITGEARLSVLRGSVEVLGFTATSKHASLPLYSPVTQSALTLRVLSATAARSDGGASDVDQAVAGAIDFFAHEARVPASSVCAFVLHPILSRVRAALDQKGREIFGLPAEDEEEEADEDGAGRKEMHKESPEHNPNTTVLAPSFTLSLTPSASHKPVVISDEWGPAVDAFEKLVPPPGCVDPDRAPIMLVCGGKDLGKSTLCRYMANRLLTRHATVMYMDTDIGQAEFTPSGLVSLMALREPVLGPPYTHQRTPVASYFIGCSSPKADPARYIRGVALLFEEYLSLWQQGKAGPLLVNTQGWVKGLGLPLLMDIVRMVTPSVIVQVASDTMPARNLPDFSSELLEETLHPAVPGVNLKVCSNKRRPFPKVVVVKSRSFVEEGTVSKYNPKDLRSLTISMYFLASSVRRSGPSLCYQETYSIPLCNVAISSDCAPSTVLYSINAAIVALCIDTDLASCSLREFSSTEHPQTKVRIVENNPMLPCVGLGFVRGIDLDKGVVYVITPVAPDMLRHANVLVKRSVEVPQELLALNASEDAPYMTSDFSMTGMIGKHARKARTNLARKRLANAGDA